MLHELSELWLTLKVKYLLGQGNIYDCMTQ